MRLEHYGLYVIGVPVGKTVWTSKRSTWSGRRNLLKADNYTSLTIERGDVKDTLSMSLSMSLTSSSKKGLLSTLPSWCSFQGMIRFCTYKWYRKCVYYYDS